MCNHYNKKSNFVRESEKFIIGAVSAEKALQSKISHSRNLVFLTAIAFKKTGFMVQIGFDALK